MVKYSKNGYNPCKKVGTFFSGPDLVLGPSTCETVRIYHQ